MYTNSSRSYLKMASGTPRRTNGTPWRTGGTPTAEYSLDGKKISKKAASEKFGKEELDRMIREATKAFAEDSLQEISWWMGEGMLSITFR